ncbi:uncharacterized protein B0H18DRAFT_1114280 [Fomitopsis serialis]|uniref:uncharacterized protein n=1 Tax=Fomitopsis serialis TaxID=139415 RepID=UPI002008488B|nr:uncharacterized protein B0H18DRAFT_1114280 [Neoantrodia serialis]KAH9935551.1 hypothetical protein B0H18DRAFT_1114280 [Neoantrodia serialis]
MGKRKAADTSDEDPEAAFSDGSDASERPLKQLKKTSKPAQKRKSKAASDDEEVRPSRRSPNQTAKKPSFKEATPEESAEESEVTVKANNEGTIVTGIVTSASPSGKPLLDIREYYGQEGDEAPGKKGMRSIKTRCASSSLSSLSAPANDIQWEKLKQNASAIDALFKKVRK